ncbi:hypothetical protein INT45_009322 [Circinella minor]|uniref:Integrase catalytic domain-containing protein n=1 Tax=Circinella minor TaxID=1195481 RepID=A0A8H7RLD7_9FUNG|nr:hypothetical protein INT45_009322 [Circinella minor]
MESTKIKILTYFLDTLEYPPGITKQQQRYLDSQSKNYFEGIKADIQQAIEQCIYCQAQGKPTKNKLSLPIAVQLQPWEFVSIDIKHSLRFANSTEVALFLYEDVICRHSTMKVCLTNNGKPFVNQIVGEVCKQFNIEHRRISNYAS